MPKYRVKELSLIGNELFQAGAEVEYDGLPAENLEPLDDEGKAKYQEYLDSNAERIKKMIAENQTSGVGDPGDFAKAMAKYQSEQTVVLATVVAEAVAAAFSRLFPDGMPVVAQAGKDKGKASLV
jgi:hypothetical protein